MTEPVPPITLPKGVRKVDARLPDGTPIVAGEYYTMRNGEKAFVLGVDDYVQKIGASWPVSIAYELSDGEPSTTTMKGDGFVYTCENNQFDLVSIWQEPAPTRDEYRNVYEKILTRAYHSYADAQNARFYAEALDAGPSGLIHCERWSINTVTGEGTLIEVDGKPVGEADD